MLKKFLIGTFAVAALAVATTVSAYDFGTTTLKVGSKGEAVKAVQTVVGATADGSFGPMTKAKVIAWQASHGLTADGVVGAKTKAAMNGGSTPSTTCPVGQYDPMTGKPCGTTPTTPVTPSSLSGLDGTIASVTQLSQYSNEEVGAAQTDVKVMGFEVKASKEGDIGINSAKLTFAITNASGSTKIADYAKSVSVWQGSTKVGSANAADFNKDSTGVYSKTVSLSGVTVKSDTTEKFYVTVDALSNLDSGDIDSEVMVIKLSNLRYVDGSGVVTTDTSSIPSALSSTGVSISFVNFSTAADTELKITTASSSPSAQVVKVSSTADTEDIVLLKGTLKLNGTSNAWIDAIPFTLTSAGDDANYVQALTGSVTLKLGDNTYTESTSIASASGTVTFDNLDYDMTAGSTVDFTVMADVFDIENTGVLATDFDQGDNLTASLTTTNRASIVVENQEGDQLTNGTEITGSAIGNAISFRSEGVNVVMGTVAYDKTEDTSGNITSVTYTIPVSVTSFGNTLYMGQTAQLAATASASNAFAVVFQNSSAPTTSDVIASASMTLSTSNATIESNGYRLDDGVTKNFTLTVVLVTPTTSNANYRVALKQLQTFTDSALYLGATSNSLTPVESYQTGYKYINS